MENRDRTSIYATAAELIEIETQETFWIFDQRRDSIENAIGLLLLTGTLWKQRGC
jgi:hypothetical protein